MSFKTYSILWIVLFCFGFPSGVFGQYIQKENVLTTAGTKTYAVIYSEGLAGAARWGTGVKMMKDGATIRHQVSKGNGGNLSVNDKIPFRFIVAPTDIALANWLVMTGVTDANNGNVNADFVNGISDSGCRHYGAKGQPGEGRTWRLPTQRELQLMWMFREPIGYIYPQGGANAQPMESTNTKKYWASTEQGARYAWYFDFKTGTPACNWQLKNSTAYGRCVSDY